MSTPYERYLAKLRPRINVTESIGPLDMKVNLKFSEGGFTFNAERLMAAIQVFRDEAIACVTVVPDEEQAAS